METYKIFCYKIWWNGKFDLYVGSTRQRLSVRMAEHRRKAKAGKTGMEIYDFIRKNGYDFNYCILDSYDVLCNEDKRKWEQHHIDLLKPNLNKLRAYNSQEDNKKMKRIVKKRYQENHVEGIKEYNAKHYEKNKIKILAKKKEWKENNKDIVSSRNKANRAKNRNIQACDCGVEFDHGGKRNIRRHKKSKAHIETTLLNISTELFY